MSLDRHASRSRRVAHGPLTGIRVADACGSLAAAYCANLFASLGAEVTALAPGALDEAQRHWLRGPRIDSDEHPRWESLDVVIIGEGHDPPPDSWSGIVLQMPWFGTSGPYATWHGSELVVQAISGHANLYGHPEREPLGGPPGQPQIATGLFGFIGTMAALLSQHEGRQTVEVSQFESMVALHQFTMLKWTMTGQVLTRMGNRYTGQGQPNAPYPCRDGWVALTAVTAPQVEAILAVTGLLHLLERPDIDSPLDFYANPAVLDEPLTAWLADQSVDEVVELFQAMRVPACPVRSPADLLTDPQVVDRGFLQPVSESEPDLLAPDVPFTITHADGAGPPRWRPSKRGDRPLAGLRVLDLARVWAGPLCTRILSDLGADVVWVEAPWSRGPRELPQSFIDAAGYWADNAAGERPWNRSGHFVKYSLGKRSVGLDLQQPQGVAAFERLVPWADVLVENYSPRVMPQFGLDEHRLHELNPHLVYLTMPGYGRSGPAEQWLAYGSCIDSHAGLSHLIGYPDQVPWKGGVAWPDPIAGLHACSALLAELWSQRNHGTGGATIEAAQFESTIAAVGDHVIRAQVGEPFRPHGNRYPGVRQGIFPCQGDDAWVAITVTGDDKLDRLSGIIGEPLRWADEDHFETTVGAWTASRDATAVAGDLQAAGIAAAPVTKAPALVADDHLRERDAWVVVDQPDVGPFTSTLTPIRLSDHEVAVRAPGPTLGQHNDEVLAMAGLTAEEIAALTAEGIVADAPPPS